jgi:hypothetical protein
MQASSAHLIGVDTLRGIALEQLLDDFDHPGHASHAAHKQNLASKPSKVHATPRERTQSSCVRTIS